MEEKQLNFDKPLLSVRHFTTGAALKNDGKSKTDKSVPNVPLPPRYKSELKSGPVRNPGTVPFVWEQSPGRPKDETKPQTETVDRPPTAPKLPPGRGLKAHQQDTDNASAKLSANRNQVGNISHGSRNLSTLEEDIGKCESPKGTIEEEENSTSGDGDEAYLDALDTLSRTESFFLNCSVSGLSGLDDADIKSSGNSAMDPQTRDFMLGRFLPAAKAMASETPQYAPRKPPIVREQPRQLKKVISGDKRPQLRYGPNFVQDYSKGHHSGDEESDDDYDEQEIFPAKVCGLLPRLGFKSSFCLLNPLPGMSVRTRAPMSPLSRTQARSSSSGSCSEFDNEQYQLDISQQRSVGGFQTTNLQVNRDNADNDSNQITSQSNYKKREGMSAHMQLEVGGVSLNRNGSLQSLEKKAALSISEEAKNSEATVCERDKRISQSFQELLADQNRSKELDTGSLVVERTLYVDTVHKLEPLNMKFSSSITKRQSDIKDKEYEILTERIEQNPIVESSVKETEKLSIVDKGAKSQPDMQKPVEFSVISSRHKPNQDMRTVTLKPFDENQGLNKDSVIKATLNVPQEGSPKKAPSKAEKLENQLEFLIPPPLPKSPTDSWLGRTLPSMSAKNASIHSYLGTGITPKYQASEPKSSDPKWETIVKTTTMQHQHTRFSEERLTPIPET